MIPPELVNGICWASLRWTRGESGVDPMPNLKTAPALDILTATRYMLTASYLPKENTTVADIFQFLADHHIAYERHDHPPVYTVADVERLTPDLPGAKTKNLFLRDKKGRRHFLVVVAAEKQVDLKALPRLVGADRLSFGSARRLKQCLGIDPGAVSLLALVNDPHRAVEVVIDRGLWEARAIQCHPLVNTSTLIISRDAVAAFLAATGRSAAISDVPQRG